MKKTLIAASVGALMLAAAGTASANSLLFPYFTTAAGAQSVLSLSNTTTSAQDLHYVYNYGTACTHYDATGSLTPNDILSHSVAAPAAGGFGLAVGSDKSVPVYFPVANQAGFVVVSTKTAATSVAQGLRGSMAIVDPSSGLVVSYAGIDNGLATNGIAGANGEGNFSAVAFNDVNFPLTALPESVASTSWYAVVLGNMGPAIAAGADWTAGYTITNNGNVYNNDEVAYSGTKTQALTCAGTIAPGDLVTSAQAAAVGPNGGLIKASATLPVNGATGLVMMKMQKVQAAVGAPFAGKQFLHREQAGL